MAILFFMNRGDRTPLELFFRGVEMLNEQAVMAIKEAESRFIA